MSQSEFKVLISSHYLSLIWGDLIRRHVCSSQVLVGVRGGGAKCNLILELLNFSDA